MDPISLSEAVAAVREQLTLALADADDTIRLDVEEIELELAVEIGRTKHGGGKVDVLGIVGLDGGTDRTDTHHHRLRLVLHPRRRGPAGTQERLALSSDASPEP